MLFMIDYVGCPRKNITERQLLLHGLMMLFPREHTYLHRVNKN